MEAYYNYNYSFKPLNKKENYVTFVCIVRYNILIYYLVRSLRNFVWNKMFKH